MKLLKYFSLYCKHIKNSLYDFRRFRKYSAYRNMDSLGKLMPVIQWDAHIIEKGLSLECPRPFFGASVFKRISRHLELYMEMGGDVNANQIHSILNVLSEYKKFNQQFIDSDTPEKDLNLLRKSEELIKKYKVDVSPSLGGTLKYSRKDFRQKAKGDWMSLSQSRFSIRHFTGEICPVEDIELAIDISRKTPSVCNRQSVRIAIVCNPEKIQRILNIQGGAGGFKEKVGALLAVCSDLNAFSLINERNQPFIDIGFFSMNLLYSFHYLGYGACPLHWFFGTEEDRKLRTIIKIPDNWTVGNLIAIGCLPEEFKVPVGHRIPLDNIIKHV